MCRYVVPQYAHKWRQLGAQLHFDQAKLDIILSNFQRDSEGCCRDLLHRWLDKNSSATWNQLLTVIDNLPQESFTNENQGYIPSCVLCNVTSSFLYWLI